MVNGAGITNQGSGGASFSPESDLSFGSQSSEPSLDE